MKPEKKQELADRLAEIREQLDAISTGTERSDHDNRTHNRQLYAEMVTLERRLFGSDRDS